MSRQEDERQLPLAAAKTDARIHGISSSRAGLVFALGWNPGETW